MKGRSKNSARARRATKARIAKSPYIANTKDFRAFRFQRITLSRGAGGDNPFVGLFGMMPTDTVPFSNHPLFQEFYEKLDFLFKLFLQNFYEGADGTAPAAERIGAARRGFIPKKYTRSRIPGLIEFGRNFAEEWDRRFAGVVGRASAFFPIAESDIFVKKGERPCNANTQYVAAFSE